MAIRATLIVLCAVIALALAGHHYGGYGKGHGGSMGQHHHHYYSQVHHHHHQDEHKEKHDHEKSEESHESEESDDHEEEHDDRVWSFQVGDNYGGYEYADSHGHLRGFHVDLLKAVCKQAGKRCHYILDIYTHCWNAAGGIEHPGVGLLDGWYDACVGYFPTPERSNSFNFSDPFTKRFQASLYVAADATIEDPKNLSNWNIGFVDGWGVNRKCLERQGSTLQGVNPAAFSAHHYQTHEDMVQALKDNKVNAMLTDDAFAAEQLGLKALEPSFYCAEGGSSMMMRYGSELALWWNEAFNDLVQSGKYSKLCEEAQKKHGDHGPMHCIE